MIYEGFSETSHWQKEWNSTPSTGHGWDWERLLIAEQIFWALGLKKKKKPHLATPYL